MIPLLLKDCYKIGHVHQYPKGTEYVYSNLTPRSSRINNIDKVVVFGLQYFIKSYLQDAFNLAFFDQAKDDVVDEYRLITEKILGSKIDVTHIEKLHDLGYLPLHVKALPEGSLCPMRVPLLTVTNTHPDFYWLPNMIETILCATVWQPITSATIAFEYRKILQKFAKQTSDNADFVQWQGHDFSFRGMSSVLSAMTSGAGHLLSFTGSDTIPTIAFLEEFYNCDIEKDLICGSVPATEHSVMSMGGKESEIETFERLLDLYPTGVLSIVSDTWDYWKVITEFLPKLKDKIMSREGKLTVRPDTGNPVEIICGTKCGDKSSPEYKGTIQLLWDIFGGTVNSKGYKELDPHIGCIYGDSITIDRCYQICRNLADAGFSSTNMVYGIGSYTYQYNTRDTFGLAMKATYGVINGNGYNIYKDPKTDSGLKKSAKGLLRVNEDYTLSEECTPEEEQDGLLETVFFNGKLMRDDSLSGIRHRLLSQL